MSSHEATVARIWRGRTLAANADRYEQYLLAEGIPPLEKTALSVQVFREDRGAETEFITISYWKDVASMAAFTGADPTAIHHLQRDAELLIELPKAVQVLRIVANAGR